MKTPNPYSATGESQTDIDNQNRSEYVRPPSTILHSRNASATFFLYGILRISSSAHHFSDISRNADRNNPAPGSNVHSIVRNSPTVSLTVRTLVVACETFFGCTSRFPFA